MTTAIEDAQQEPEPQGPARQPARGQDRLEWAATWAERGAPAPPADVVRRLSRLVRGLAYALQKAGDDRQAGAWADLRKAARIYHICRVRQLRAAGRDLDAWRAEPEGARPAGSVAALIASANAYAGALAEMRRRERRFRQAAMELAGDAKPRRKREPKAADSAKATLEFHPLAQAEPAARQPDISRGISGAQCG